MNSNKDRTEIQELMVEIAVLKARIESADKALSLQAQEYSRRLEALNESHKSMDIDRARYVTREMHDQLYQEMLRRLEGCVTISDFKPIRDQVKINTEKFGEALANNAGRNAMLYAMIASVVSIGGLLIGFYHTFIEHIK